ncbi:MAG: tetratricopeptide repeat protein [Roseomonas sp.]|nr:tetratricopeptide repeat protein [Roseomonas sp.]MCA3318653.1 tetratricopeptide repeat protein [Roseomonas sp.]MCA3321926.1 tetratricopeptide repeat protein [Roseomonas sp.]
MTLRPQNASAQFLSAIALLKQGNPAAAEAACLAVLKREPRHADALHLAGLLATQLGQLDEGINRLRRALAIKPKDAAIHGHLGLALVKGGHDAEAMVSFEKSLALNPNSPETALNYGQLLLHLGRAADAVAVFNGLIADQANYAEAHHQRGRALMELGQLEAALAAHEEALGLHPNSPDYLIGIAIALCALGRAAEALPFAEKALQLKPSFDLAMLSRAEIMLALGHRHESLAVAEEVLRAAPQTRRGRRWLGKLLMALGQPESALLVATLDCTSGNDDPVAHINHGTILTALNQLEEALLSYDRALRLKPDHAEARYNRAFTLLALGRFEDGWRDYEYRHLRPTAQSRRKFSQPIWQGRELLQDQRLLIQAEQGFGDTIQFARYGLLAAAAGADVILAVQKPLLRLFKDFHPGVLVVDEDEATAEFDLHCPMLSLPLAFGTRLETIPAWPDGYLKAPAEEAARFAARLPKGRRRIGVVWSGSTIHTNDANRSMALERLLPLFQSGDVWVSLQKEVRAADQSTFHASGLCDLTAELSDFADTASLIAALDLVIAVDTSVAHLAAALGKPVWLMLPFAPDFRWLFDREDSPWYPGMRLFRQQGLADWNGVVARISAALQP